MKIKVHEHKKSEGFKEYKAIQEWLENVMDKADTMFGRAYVTDNRPGEIAVEIEGWDSSDGDCIGQPNHSIGWRVIRASPVPSGSMAWWYCLAISSVAWNIRVPFR